MTNSFPAQASALLDKVDLVFSWMWTSPIEIVGIAGILIFGYVLKSIPKFPNQYIPLATFAMAIFYYGFILSPSKAPQVQMDPRHWMGGVVAPIAWAIAWISHGLLSKKLGLDRLLFKKDYRGNTRLKRKPKPQMPDSASE
jgi:hypothetical protein